MVLPTSVLMILFLEFGFALLDELKKSYQYSSLVSTSGVPWEPIDTLQGVSKIHCAVHCCYVEDCVSVHYNSSSATCHLLKPQTICSSGWTLPGNIGVLRRHEGTDHYILTIGMYDKKTVSNEF